VVFMGPAWPPYLKGRAETRRTSLMPVITESISSLVLSFIQKRFLYKRNLMLPTLFNLTNYSSLMEPSSPPISSLLLPAKRYENLKRSLSYYQNNDQNLGSGIMEKINIHQQQRLVKRLYNIPVKESFQSEIIENRLSSFSNASLMIGSMSPSRLQKTSSSNWFVRNRIFTRHSHYLTNQWWTGQLPEHNAETTFLSDIDWRYTFVEREARDILLDFPDADQHYNPRNRRWVGNTQSTFGTIGMSSLTFSSEFASRKQGTDGKAAALTEGSSSANTSSLNNSFIEENSIEFSSRKLEYFLPEGEKNSTFVSPNNSVAKPDIYKGTSRASNTENAELRQLRANNSFESDSYSNSIRPPKEKFTEAPLKGMNAATTLYWQIPFTTYDPDQFFALGMDGFSPLGWRKMLFRHSILKTWLGDKTMRNKKKDSVSPTTFSGESTIGIKNSINHQDLLSTLQKTKKGSYLINNRDNSNRQDGFNTSRRLKKRLLRVKKHPRTPVWFPSGPLLNQVLPVHYIYVFYKRTRLPRNRYLSRRLLSVNNIKNSETFNALISSNPSLYNYDFTLRKRLKPKRKYHLKHDSSIVIPRRLKFLNWIQQNPLTDDKFQFSSQQDINSLIRWRPLSSKKINKSFSELMNEQKTLRAKRQQRLAGVSPMDQPSLRVKQLKRRVQRQVIRAVWRYRPRAGGFVWPGDYLKLELTQAPKLKSTKISSDNLQSNISDLTPQNKLRNTSESNQNVDTLPKRKTKRKKKRTLVEWQVQPKKYLYAKHNAKVLKKKLERAHRSGNTPLQQKGKVEV